MTKDTFALYICKEIVYADDSISKLISGGLENRLLLELCYIIDKPANMPLNF